MRTASRLAQLDALTIPAPQTGRPVQRLGVAAQFCFPGGHRPAAREATVEVVLDAYGIAPAEFAQWMGPGDERPRTIGQSLSSDLRLAVDPYIDRSDELLSLALLQRDNPPGWQAEAMLRAC